MLYIALELFALGQAVQKILGKPHDIVAVLGLCDNERLRGKYQDVLAIQIHSVDLINADSCR